MTWQLRQHSTALIAAGAIAIVARQHLFHVDRTPTVLIEQGILLAALAATKPKAPVPPGGHVRGRPRIHPVLELSKAVQGMTRKAVKSGVPA